MKIGIVCYPTYGGSGVVATELGKGLAAKGHEVHFITYSQPQRLDIFNNRIFYHEVNTSTYPLFQYPPYELALSSTIVDVALHEKLDLLHVHYAIPHASAGYMAREILKTKGVYMPVVTTLHGTDITLVGRDASYEPVVTFSINASDGVTAVSQYLKEDTYKHFQVTKDIKVIPNFVDLNRFRQRDDAGFKRSFCPNGEKLVVHTSNFRPVKRVQDVVKVFNELQKEVPARLVLIGDGPERQKIENSCRDMGICDKIRFLGKIDSVENVLAAADLFLMPSEHESFGLAALEAMASGVPVISTNSGGLPEVNVHGDSGFLSEVGDVEDMVRNALYILDESHLDAFKQQAYARARQFDIEQVLPLYEQYYEQVLAAVSHDTASK